jgi:hypothetical protein
MHTTRYIYEAVDYHGVEKSYCLQPNWIEIYFLNVYSECIVYEIEESQIDYLYKIISDYKAVFENNFTSSLINEFVKDEEIDLEDDINYPVVKTFHTCLEYFGFEKNYDDCVLIKPNRHYLVVSDDLTEHLFLNLDLEIKSYQSFINTYETVEMIEWNGKLISLEGFDKKEIVIQEKPYYDKSNATHTIYEYKVISIDEKMVSDKSLNVTYWRYENILPYGKVIEMSFI